MNTATNEANLRLTPLEFSGMNAEIQRKTVEALLKPTGITATAARGLDKTGREAVYADWYSFDLGTAAATANSLLRGSKPEPSQPAAQPVSRSDSPKPSNDLDQIKELLGVKSVDAEQVKQIVAGMLQDVSMSEADFDRAVKVAQDRAVKRIEIVKPDGETVNIGLQHFMFDEVLTWAMAGENIMLVGPAGSGKTTLGMNLGKALDRKFEMTAFSSQTTEAKLLGYMSAQGEYVETALYRAYKYGYVFLADELDNGNPNVVTALNALLENGKGAFACGMVDRHPDFVCICAANTFGRGADRLYVGRNQLDAATLDRFANIEFNYDEDLEREIALSKAGDNLEQARAWVDMIQRLRKAVFDLKERVIISPRASMKGVKMLAAGLSEDRLLDTLVWKGISADIRNKITAAAGV